MKYILLLPLIAVVFNSCFTSKLLDEQTNVSAIPPDSYSFNRAYYSSDSILHIDFNNDDSHRKKTKYYGISININAILKEYYKANEDIVYFRHKITRHYKALNAGTMLKNCTCIETYHYRNSVVIDFEDIRVSYLRSLPLIKDSALIKKTDIMAANCCLWPQVEENNESDAGIPINTPTTIYIMPVANAPDGFVALRFPLKSRKTKIGLLPLSILLDIVTSPIQLAGLIIENKLTGNDSNNGNTKKASSTETKKDTQKDKKKQ